MFSAFCSCLVFSTMEYFSYFNLWLIILFLFLCLFFLIFSSCQLLISSILCSGAVFEFSLIFFCFFFVIIIISPALIILLDAEIIIVPSFLVYSCGFQWAWTFNSMLYFNSNCDHYLLSSYYLTLSFKSLDSYLLAYSLWCTACSIFSPFAGLLISCALFFWSLILNSYPLIVSSIFCALSSILASFVFFCAYFYLLSLPLLLVYSAMANERFTGFYSVLLSFNSNFLALFPALFSSPLNPHRLGRESFCFDRILTLSTLYFFTCNSVLLIPIFSTVRFFVFSYDVIHSLGIYSFGIKIDAIPGRFNYASTLRTLIKGEHRGFCYELCGHGHSSMLIIAKTS